MKRFLALTLAGVVTFASSAFAAELPENHWAYSYMSFGEAMDWCDKTQYADNITYEYADEIMSDVSAHLSWGDSEKDRFFDVINYTNGYVTRGEWAEALETAISMEYDEVVDICADEDIAAVKTAKDGEYTHEPMSFGDVDASNKYADAISFCNDYKLMNGYGDNTFGADEYITYAEAMSSVYRLFNTENDILTDMGVDMEMFCGEYFSGYDDGYAYAYAWLDNMNKKLDELSEKAEKGTLKSTRKLDKATEAAIDRTMQLASIFENGSRFSAKANVAVTADVSYMGVDVKGDYTVNADCNIVLDDDGNTEAYAIKLNTKLDSPELKALLGIDDAYTSRTIEYYLKDGIMYVTDGEDKYSVPYDTVDDEDTSEDDTSVNIVASGDEAKLIMEYFLREGAESGSVTPAEDGKETVTLSYDVKRLLTSIGLDIDKLIEDSESDMSIELNPLEIVQVVNSDNKTEKANVDLSGSFDVEGAKGSFGIACDIAYDYDEKPIVYPDFSEYKDVLDMVVENFGDYLEKNVPDASEEDTADLVFDTTA
jgi:hypothetical protein